MELKEKFQAESQNKIHNFKFNETKTRKEVKQDEIPQFKAKPVPAFVNVDEFKRRQEEDEKAREERIKVRIADQVANSKLPPRLEEFEKNKEENKKNSIRYKKRYQEEQFDYKPKIKKEVPNFAEEQQKFTQDLDTKKAERPKTESIPFSFQVKRTI